MVGRKEEIETLEPGTITQSISDRTPERGGESTCKQTSSSPKGVRGSHVKSALASSPWLLHVKPSFFTVFKSLMCKKILVEYMTSVSRQHSAELSVFQFSQEIGIFGIPHFCISTMILLLVEFTLFSVLLYKLIKKKLHCHHAI